MHILTLLNRASCLSHFPTLFDIGKAKGLANLSLNLKLDCTSLILFQFSKLILIKRGVFQRH